MKTKLSTLLLGTLLLAMNAFAIGDKGGNGGDGVVCENSVELLDSYEMRSRGFVLGLSGTRTEMIEQALKNLERVDERNAINVRSYAKELDDAIAEYEQTGVEGELIHFTGDQLRDIPDSMETSIPQGCHIEQLVIQQEPNIYDKRYTISSRLWNKLSVEQKALTILHESWYRTTLDMGATNSRVARMLNGIMASTKGSNLSVGAYLKYAQSSEVMSRFSFIYKLRYNQLFDDVESAVYWPLPTGTFNIVGNKLECIQGCSDFYGKLKLKNAEFRGLYRYAESARIKNITFDEQGLSRMTFHSAFGRVVAGDLKVAVDEIYGSDFGFSNIVVDLREKKILSFFAIATEILEGDKYIFRQNVMKRVSNYVDDKAFFAGILIAPVIMGASFSKNVQRVQVTATDGSDQYEYKKFNKKLEEQK